MKQLTNKALSTSLAEPQANERKEKKTQQKPIISGNIDEKEKNNRDKCICVNWLPRQTLSAAIFQQRYPLQLYLFFYHFICDNAVDTVASIYFSIQLNWWSLLLTTTHGNVRVPIVHRLYRLP